eukprot:GEMP01026738.1.p1 GENE.GEMP01026738.1~~GEMP01026738.1.p1  ORF type:complete len:522 (+),score=62.98 GEMP01026738.1:144-1709(+)
MEIITKLSGMPNGTARVMDAEAVQLHRALVQRNDENQTPTRSQSFHGIPTSPPMDRPNMASLKEPGGFRRNYLQNRADEAGVPEEFRPKVWQSRIVDYTLTLSLFEDYGGKEHPSVEDTERHVTSNTKVFFALLKANVGPGALFLPQAFQNGGYAVSVIGILLLAVLASVCTLRLLAVRNDFGGKLTYGEVLETAFSSRIGKFAVDVSIGLLQFGICTTYFIFIGNLLQDVLCPGSGEDLQTYVIFIALQLLIIVPLCWVRQVARLAVTNILADVLIIGCLVAIISYEVQHMIQNPPTRALSAGGQSVTDPQSAIVAANSWDHILVYFGTACFVFEGIGLVIPTKDSMREKDKFPQVFCLAMFCIAVIFLLCGLGGYFTFRGPNEPKSIVLQDLPESPFWVVVSLAYATAVTFTFPFQFLPVIRLIEAPLFGTPVSNPPYSRKVLKSLYRTGIVISLAVIAVKMRKKLEHFVSLIGAFCGVPLSESLWNKATNALLFIFGVGVMIFCSAINIYKICFASNF